MNNNQNLRSIPLSLWLSLFAAMTALFLTTTAFASTPQGTFDRTLQVNGPVNLEVLTRSGDVTIRAGGSGSVQIHGKIYANHWNILPGIEVGGKNTKVQEVEQNPPIRQEGNSIHIDYVNMHDISVDYEITVPADTTIRTHSGSGDQILEGTHGNAEIETGSGDVKMRNVTGEIRLQTGSGDVRALGISGAVRGGAGSGDIELEETGPGDVDFHTGSGNITVRGLQGAFHGEAGSGDISAEGTQTGSWEVRTGSGNVHVKLPQNAAFDADISTSSGSLDVDAPIETTVQGHIGESHKRVQGKARGGGPMLSVHTGSGDIHIQ
jgi:DUF4097 and DUF4098 domain-containing protein YvlB